MGPDSTHDLQRIGDSCYRAGCIQFSSRRYLISLAPSSNFVDFATEEEEVGY